MRSWAIKGIALVSFVGEPLTALPSLIATPIGMDSSSLLLLIALTPCPLLPEGSASRLKWDNYMSLQLSTSTLWYTK